MAAKRFRTDGFHAFYPIVSSTERVLELLEFGVKTVQLRAKGLEGQARFDAIGRALEAAKAYEAQLIINDYWREALALNASWVHLGQEDLDTADLEALRLAGIGVGISSHTPGERDRAIGLDPAYIALGPVRETTAKAMPFAPQGLERVAIWSELATCPVCAIGGLRLEDELLLRASGARLVAVMSAIDRPDADRHVRTWLEAMARVTSVMPNDANIPRTPQTMLYRARRGETEPFGRWSEDAEQLRQQVARGHVVLGDDRLLTGTVTAADLPAHHRMVDATALTSAILQHAQRTDALLVLTGTADEVIEATRRAWNDDVSVVHAYTGPTPPDRDWGVPRLAP